MVERLGEIRLFFFGKLSFLPFSPYGNLQAPQYGLPQLEGNLA
ncbi:MAG: hypothetical protein QW447_02600 [Candidatus Bathyarchaeia archaeon]